MMLEDKIAISAYVILGIMVVVFRRRVLAFWRGVKCSHCGSRNIALGKYKVVSPKYVKDANYVGSGQSLGALMGLKSAIGTYKKTMHGDICQTRDETYTCHKCGKETNIRRERIVAHNL